EDAGPVEAWDESALAVPVDPVGRGHPVGSAHLDAVGGLEHVGEEHEGGGAARRVLHELRGHVEGGEEVGGGQAARGLRVVERPCHGARGPLHGLEAFPVEGGGAGGVAGSGHGVRPAERVVLLGLALVDAEEDDPVSVRQLLDDAVQGAPALGQARVVLAAGQVQGHDVLTAGRGGGGVGGAGAVRIRCAPGGGEEGGQQGDEGVGG